MKKILCLCFILCLSLSGCQASRVPGLDWEAEKMVELTVYQTTSYFDCPDGQSPAKDAGKTGNAHRRWCGV